MKNDLVCKSKNKISECCKILNKFYEETIHHNNIEYQEFFEKVQLHFICLISEIKLTYFEKIKESRKITIEKIKSFNVNLKRNF